MKKFMSIAAIAALFATGAQAAYFTTDSRLVLQKHPLPASVRSTDFGGTKQAIDAYEDGVGVVLSTVNPDLNVDNSPTNELVYKYGAKVKELNEGGADTALQDYVLIASNTTEKEIIYAETLNTQTTIIEAEGIDAPAAPAAPLDCDDGNPDTIDTEVGGVCVNTPESCGVGYFGVEGAIDCSYNNMTTIASWGLIEVNTLDLSSNPDLTSLAGLESLTAINTSINLRTNGSLADVSALSNATVAPGGVVWIDPRYMTNKLPATAPICVDGRASTIIVSTMASPTHRTRNVDYICE
jgi:hypothetical protein